jgi:hypothetical protein
MRVILNMKNQFLKVINLKNIFNFIMLSSFFGGVQNCKAARVGGLTHFVEPEHLALTLLPEAVFSSTNNGSGIAASLDARYGFNDFFNASLIVGHGLGPRTFRTGANADFDIFPDVEGQVGIGAATQLIYYQLKKGSLWEASLIPYIHKTFFYKGQEIEPFLAVPLGVSLFEWNGESDSVADFSTPLANKRPFYVVTIGMGFSLSESFRYSVDIAIPIQYYPSVLEVGLTYTF